MIDKAKGYIFIVVCVVIVLIFTLGGYSNYKKCSAAGGELIRAWVAGNRCLVIEREIDLWSL